LSKLIQNDVLNGLNQENLDCYFLKTIDSTNAFAKKLPLEKPILVVLAEEQTAGKGRHGKKWHSPESGNIYLSIKYQINSPHSPLSLIVGLLIVEALDEVSGQKINARLKWPNDILLNKKKICGILIESEVVKEKMEYTIGIGVNYSIPKTESWWGDLEEQKDVLPREKLINAILKKIIFYKDNDYLNWQEQWESRCMHQNIEIFISTKQQKEINGIFRGVDNEGKMLLETSNGIQAISSGECSIKGLY
jgi:BirA family biotin operon repressor/biotin-[acetyl-CoA-carboxylase] ligase